MMDYPCLDLQRSVALKMVLSLSVRLAQRRSALTACHWARAVTEEVKDGEIYIQQDRASVLC